MISKLTSWPPFRSNCSGEILIWVMTVNSVLVMQLSAVLYICRGWVSASELWQGRLFWKMMQMV